MDSPDHTETTLGRLLPFFGILQMDLRRMARSWTVRGWLILAVLLAFGPLPDAIKGHVTAAQYLQNVLSIYIFVWSTAVIIVTAGAVSSESGVVADSVLSRGLTRYGYILSKYLSRLITVTVVCLAVTVPVSYFASLHLGGELPVRGLALAHAYVLVHMACLTVLGVTFSIWLDKPFAGIAVLWVICYFFGSICSALDVTFLAPAQLVRGAGDLLAGREPAAAPWKVILWLGTPSVALAVCGSLRFARRDV